jgi:hypothetical protein
MKKAREQKQASWKNIIAYFHDKYPDSPDILHELMKLKNRKLSASLPATPNIKWTELRGDAQFYLNSAELILLIAFFEAFMKQIHKQVLLAKPILLACIKPKRPIKLKELFRNGFERIKIDETSRQVREADRLPTKDKAIFFQRKLKLGWGDDIPMDRVSELIEQRHKIVHMTHDWPITDKDVKDARKLFLAIPKECINKATKIYSTHFAK